MGAIFNLCGADWTAYVLDIIAALFFVIATLVCGSKGFFNCILGMVSSLVAFVLAITLANVFLDITGGLFGLQDVLAETFHGVFVEIEGFDADISKGGLEAALEEHNVSAIIAQLVLKSNDSLDTIAAGTTLAQVVSEATAALAGALISGIVIFILIKLIVKLLKKILNGVTNSIRPLRGLNVVLGSVFGFVYALVIVSLILAIATVLPFNALHEYLSDSLLLGLIFENNPLVYVLSWFL